MENVPQPPHRRISRVLVIGTVGLLVVLGLILVIRLTAQPVVATSNERTDALANSNDRCVVCHRRASPGIVQAIRPQHDGGRQGLLLQLS